MGVAVKLMGAVDIIAAAIILTGNYWIGFYLVALVLLIKGIISLFS